ncbi:MAG: hypothetical protein SAK29_35950, partial [Scytonema sp. PMC 1069.18]|nr:hypothetical protein [Scytonema sp. PMC 1069.18]
MTNACNPQHHSKLPFRKRKWLLVLSRGGIAIGGLLVVGITGGAWRLWNFIHKDLVPIAESSLTTTLNRPVELGKVKDFSLTGVKFGASAIPATPTDHDRATVEMVEVGFNPLQLLFNRRLKLDVTLVNPDVYIDRDKQGRWIVTTIAPPSEGGAIKTELENLRFRNARLVLVPEARGAESQKQGSREQGVGNEKVGSREQGVGGEKLTPSIPSSPHTPYPTP